jgi:alanine racemase
LAAAELRPSRWHLANSAGALAWPAAGGDLVRAGIAVYGIEPGPAVAHHCEELRPALTLRSRVSMVKTVSAGSGVSYGWHSVLDRDTVVATVPIGYADGVPRRLSFTGGEVLIGGKRRRILGVVTMDQLMVDCGDDAVAYGDEVILLGRQDHEVIRVEEWAERLGTIPYEIVCGISARVPRRWTGEGQ